MTLSLRFTCLTPLLVLSKFSSFLSLGFELVVCLDLWLIWSLVAEGTASLLSLVKTFDSVLAVYEGFCNLKQVSTTLFLIFLIICLDAEKTEEGK